MNNALDRKPKILQTPKDSIRVKAEKFAEEVIEFNRLTKTLELLAQYHAKSIDVIVRADALAENEASSPVGRKYSKLITPWNDFASKHRNMWDLSRASSTYSNQLFDSLSTIKAVMLQDVRSELDLVLMDDLIFLRPVKAILNRLYEDEEARKKLDIQAMSISADY